MQVANRPHISTRFTVYLGLLAGTAVLVGLALGQVSGGVEQPWITLALAGTAVIAERWSVRLSATTQLSVYLLPAAFAALIIGPLEAGIVGAASMLGNHEIGRHAWRDGIAVYRSLNYASNGFLAGVIAGLTAQALQPLVSSSIGSSTVMALGAMAVAEGSDFAAALATATVRGRSPRETASRIGPVALTSFLVFAPVLAFLHIAYTELSPWTAPLFLVPALALQRVYTLYQHQRQLTGQLSETNEQLTAANETLRNANLSFATALVQTLEESDRYTAGHSRAVANYARDIGYQLGLSKDEQDRLFLCGLVHDIGKIGLPGSLLNKEGRLTLEERREMEMHSEIGERILAKVEAYADVARIVRHHHERVDGEGYPDGLRDDDIPLESRVIAVADAYNAMTSDRPYRKAMDYEIARDRLLQAMGSQFFTEPVIAFLAVLANADESYRYARGEEFGPVVPEEAYSVLVEAASRGSLAADAA
jgi:hypothetical protein